jgi:hypothetical protein
VVDSVVEELARRWLRSERSERLETSEKSSIPVVDQGILAPKLSVPARRFDT